ncbi:mitochondrial outer membrane translocase complex, subunit Tom22 [Bisporella sp. PMI_857]|nr:mitochondrial outer membrane translocase complex, subunit Tom22 [Bisporella sp. PMI_857]KAH8600371.1 mitochondrial outer membrane translocase complex, subunit Tom22 [Bisporella sp. PMI_857]
MVELVEVEDESFENKQAGLSEETTKNSEISSDEDEYPAEDETFTDRIAALRDIIPPTTRSYISGKVDTTTGWIKSSLIFGGKSLWVISTGVLLLGVPWALAFAEEQQMVEMEKEMKAREQLLQQGVAPQAQQSL